MVVCTRSVRPSIPCVHQRRGQLTNYLAGQAVPVSVLHLLQLPQNALSRNDYPGVKQMHCQ